MNNRIEQLDSIRGLAALCVFISHIILVKTEIFTEAMRSPLRLFTNGHAAVMLFFVLSGFVLSLAFLNKNNVLYISYFIKRVFRIYIPYLVAIATAMISSIFFFRGTIDGLSDWFNSSWTELPNLYSIIEHIFILRNIHTDTFNNVIWSLVHELRISIIFPFVVLFIKNIKAKYSLLLCFALSFLSGLNNIFQFQISMGLLTNYFTTIHYLSIFILGVLVAKYRFTIIHFYRQLTIPNKWIFLIMSVIIYNFADTIIPEILISPIFGPYLLIIEEYFQALGAIGFITAALGSDKVAWFLMRKPLIFLGKISYSLYLYHLIVLLSCVHILYGLIPIWQILIGSMVLSIGVSALFYYLIENPCIKFGRVLAEKTMDKEIDKFIHKSKENYKNV
ncbi:acyltransferase family protein [Metabacillus sediminilitoris]|uniref:Acyltransferase n=1 Tax=Metabacillus sediminilitoris TaxID=2567941 RepID=A0A4S4BZ70_9BACI|nr:acyltransferase [Metabacillus sediminilitoris]QGQ47221.1 acyltransferase family protein [Metabacillus sediminilitoris]THF80565.1 acyltransferase [Metabacillus sediminilitoris]